MADTQIHDMGIVFERTLRALQGYGRTNPASNPTALRTLAADAQRLLAAGNPYARIAELEAKIGELEAELATVREGMDDKAGQRRRAPRSRGAA